MDDQPEPPATTPSTFCLPMKLDAFLVNSQAVGTNSSRLALFSHPEYAKLRLDDEFRTNMKHDVFPTIDLRYSSPGFNYNDRITDLTTGDDIKDRHGIYLHWILPRFYRTGLTITGQQSTLEPNTADDLKRKLGYKSPSSDDPRNPIYHSLPTRWVIVRHITKSDPPAEPEFEAFVIESDRLRRLTELDAKVDLQVDVSPFLHVHSGEAGSELRHQGEYFIGIKNSLDGWKEKTAERASLSTITSINHLFADYQPHNSNVFSMLDNTVTKYTDATANYYVMGWHADEDEDPFHDGGADLEACRMKLVDGGSDPLQVAKGSRLILHGAVYNVAWSQSWTPVYDNNIYLNQAYESYSAQHNYSPIAVGGSPIDALIAALHTQDLESGSGWSPIALDLLALQMLVHVLEEDPDSQIKSVDALHTSTFIPSEGGLHWHVKGTKDVKQPMAPPPAELADLNTVNASQLFIDLCHRDMKSIQWLLWAEWWKWVTGGPGRTNVKEKVDGFVASYMAVRAKATDVEIAMSNILDKYRTKWESAPKPRYYIPKDPTVLLCGLKDPWPSDFAQPLKVRLESKLPKAGDIKPIKDDYIDEFPEPIQEAAKKLLSEFYKLGLPQDDKEDKDDMLPLYHDCVGGSTIMRDDWHATQPWFPLFVEWEIEYVHIHEDLWEPAERKPYGPPMLRSKIVDKKLNDANSNELQVDFKKTRVLSGRELVVPGIGAVVKAAVEQLLKVKAPEKPDLLKKIAEVLHNTPFLNITLSGVRDQLATRNRGTHISPTMYHPDHKEGGLPLQEAIKASEGVFSNKALELIGDTTVTPFGDFSDFGGDDSPFKFATNGQFRFTKLNVVDKFGQALCAINPLPGTDSKLFPYISEIYSPPDIPSSLLPGGVNPWKSGEAIHIAPSINQESRINGHYVKHDKTSWVPMTEYDNPIWGWLVINYPDRGLQIFLPDGTFYCEIRLGQKGASSSPKWLPFGKPPVDSKVPDQLSALIKRFVDKPSQLQEFFDVINKALESDVVPYAHNLYAGYLPSITGRPLALVNTGWSLELSQRPHVNQSTSGSTGPTLDKYHFPIKLGDRDRTFDGVLGYFIQNDGHEKYEYDTFYTYFAEKESEVTKSIKPENYPLLTPYHTLPEGKKPEDIIDEYNSKLNVFSMLIEPFTAIHGYTSCQPIKELQLPHWALEQSLAKITAFFHMGPIIMPFDVPQHRSDYDLVSGMTGSEIDEILKKEKDVSPFPIPSVTIADWAWLQPYYQGAKPDDEKIAFNPFPVTGIKRVPEFNETPYTAIEGYLYLKKPIVEPEIQ